MHSSTFRHFDRATNKNIKDPKARAFIYTMRVTSSKELFELYYTWFAEEYKGKPALTYFLTNYGKSGEHPSTT